MFSTFAGLIMATKIHFAQMKYPVYKRQNQQVAESIYKNKVNKLEETEKFEKSQMPKSGYMTVEEYEELSRAKTKEDIEISPAKQEKDANMVYVPQKTYKLVKYNDPIGSPELSLPRKLNFNRQINAQGIVSGDRTKLVYPSVYYYAQTDCTSCDLFLINLDSSLSDTEKVMKANIIQKETEPLLSTSKDISEKYIFRTLTPIDFSVNNDKLIIKEKTGHKYDGIWQTDLWVYNFETKKATKFPQIRDAIVQYWERNENINLDEKRWDIYPMGFDANDDTKIIVCAYAYTGDNPKFLGTWSIDIYGTTSKLESIDGTGMEIAVIGYRLVEDDVQDISEVEFEIKAEKHEQKQKAKKEKEINNFNKKVQTLEYKRKITQMDIKLLMDIKKQRALQKQMKKNTKIPTSTEQFED